MSGFAMFFFQHPSLLQFQQTMEQQTGQSNLQRLFGVTSVPSDTQMRELLDTPEAAEPLRRVLPQVFERMQRTGWTTRFVTAVNGVNYYTVGLDGSQYFSSATIQCPYCLQRQDQNGDLHYAHSVVATILGLPVSQWIMHKAQWGGMAGWRWVYIIEGIPSVILGVVLGGQLVGTVVSHHLLAFDLPMIDTGINTAPEAAIVVIGFLYVIAALFNLRIPRTDAPLQPIAGNVGYLLRDFSSCNARLWGDKLGQISLSTTTLFWGILGNLRVIVFAWAAAALGYTVTQASTLVGVVAIGTAIGAVVASTRMRLDQATKVIPLGIGMGVLMIGLNFLTNVWVAAPFLIMLGAIGGYLVVPMNALLQHRGANLMGAGRSIAVQNFNEQACILGLGAFLTGMTKFGLGAFTTITVFGLVVAGTMYLIHRWHHANLVNYKDEVEHLLAIARSDKH